MPSNFLTINKIKDEEIECLALNSDLRSPFQIYDTSIIAVVSIVLFYRIMEASKLIDTAFLLYRTFAAAPEEKRRGGVNIIRNDFLPVTSCLLVSLSVRGENEISTIFPVEVFARLLRKPGDEGQKQKNSGIMPEEIAIRSRKI